MKKIFFLILLIFISSCSYNELQDQENLKKLVTSEQTNTLPPLSITACENLDDESYIYKTYDDFKNITTRTKCLNRVALLQSVTSSLSEGLQVCNGITNPFGKELCYFIVNNNEKTKTEIETDFLEEDAVANKDPSLCRAMKTDEQKIQLCLAKIAISTDNVSFCKVFSQTKEGIYAQFYCVFNIAKNNNDPDLCEEITSEEKIGDCYNDFAYQEYKKKNYEKSARYCEKIEHNKEQKETCLDRALVRTKYWQDRR